MSQYLDLFVSEAREHLRRMAELVPALEAAPAERATIDALFRAAHSVKGMAASMEFTAITELAHRLEDLLDRVRHGLPVTDGLGGLLLAGADTLEGMVGAVAAGATDGQPVPELLAQLADYPSAPPPQPAISPVQSGSPSTTAEEPATPSASESWEPTQTVRVRTGVLDRFVNITGELVTVKHRLVSLAGEVGEARLGEAVGDLVKLLRELHDQVLTVRLTPFATVADRFPRIARDLARKSGKELAFVVQGKELELDRGILEGLAEPLLHLLRNAIDHGIELPAERQAAGKPPAGVVTLAVRRDRDQVVITVTDDGRGMDPAALRATAIARGLLTAEKAARLTSREAFLLVCAPGFSTARTITDVSGRGVGMDVVKTTVQALNGTLSIEAEPGRGCSFTLKLPLSISIINVLMVDAAGVRVAVPVTSVQRTLELERRLIVSQGTHQAICLDGETVPLLSLNRLLARPVRPPTGAFLAVFVCELQGRRVGVVVDHFIGHREVFVKPLGRPLACLKGVSGGAVLGDGEIVFVLDVPSLL